MMAGLRAEMRPYLALRHPVLRLTLGSWALARRLCRACLAGEGWNKAWRALGALLLAGTAGRVAEQQPLLMVPVTLGWLAAAWRAAPAPAAEQEQPEVKGETLAEPAHQAPLPTREHLLAALHAVAAPHAQTTPLAEHLGTTTARVREALTHAGIPIADGVRMKGRSSAAGVKAEHIPPLPPPLSDPSPGVVAAGESAATTTATEVAVERYGDHTLIFRHTADQSRNYRV